MVNLLKDFQIFPDDIEAEWIELRGDFETFVDSIVPPLINNKGFLKAYQEWRPETLERVDILINRVSNEMDMQLLQSMTGPQMMNIMIGLRGMCLIMNET